MFIQLEIYAMMHAFYYIASPRRRKGCVIQLKIRPICGSTQKLCLKRATMTAPHLSPRKWRILSQIFLIQIACVSPPHKQYNAHFWQFIGSVFTARVSFLNQTFKLYNVLCVLYYVLCVLKVQNNETAISQCDDFYIYVITGKRY